MAVAQFVVGISVHQEQLEWLLANTPAHVALVLFDDPDEHDGPAAAVAAESKRETLKDRLKDNPKWETAWTDANKNAVMYRRDRVRSIRFTVSTFDARASCFLECFDVNLVPGTNPDISIAMAIFCPARGYPSETKYWPDEFVDDAVAVIKNRGVRVIMGVFTCPHVQVYHLALECGVAGKRPFCQAWYEHHENPEEVDVDTTVRWDVAKENGMNYRVHPAYMMVTTPCAKIVYPSTEAAPWLPEWLQAGNGGIAKLCGALKDAPTWPPEPQSRSRGFANFDLGKCQQKPADLRWWVPGIHQLLLFLGTSREGKGAARARFANAVDKAIQKREQQAATWTRQPRTRPSSRVRRETPQSRR